MESWTLSDITLITDSSVFHLSYKWLHFSGVMNVFFVKCSAYSGGSLKQFSVKEFRVRDFCCQKFIVWLGWICQVSVKTSSMLNTWAIYSYIPCEKRSNKHIFIYCTLKQIYCTTQCQLFLQLSQENLIHGNGRLAFTLSWSLNSFQSAFKCYLDFTCGKLPNNINWTKRFV